MGLKVILLWISLSYRIQNNIYRSKKIISNMRMKTTLKKNLAKIKTKPSWILVT